MRVDPTEAPLEEVDLRNFFNRTPEDADKVAEIRRFVAEHCPGRVS